ncbi:MAG: energy transducer TonB [Acidobacteria bacterium]|nr:MAG: energy transducer TonB [Acidobacteriota bacterium]
MVVECDGRAEPWLGAARPGPMGGKEAMMLEGVLLESTGSRQTASIRWHFLITMIVYSLGIATAMVVSILLATPQLKRQPISTAFLAPLPLSSSGDARSPVRSRSQNAHRSVRAITIPSVPMFPSPTTDEVPPVESETQGGGSDALGALGGSGNEWGEHWLGETFHSIGPLSLPTPARSPQGDPHPSQTRRISSGVLLGKAIRRATPIYPQLARQMRVAGTVHVEVVIDERGRVISASIMKGPPLLWSAALEAARRWVFRPTLLNGRPVKVTGVLIFRFNL